MPKDDEKGIIFIHIPKTGGTYIDINIFNLKLNEIHGEMIKKYFIGYSEMSYSHLTLFEMNKMININAYKYMFTFVRNPYDRVVSNYVYNGHLFKEKNFREYIYDLRDYVENNKNIFVENIPDFKLNQLYKHYALNQVDFLTLNENIYDKIKIFKFEEFEKSIRQLILDLELNFQYSTEKINNTVHNDYKSYYEKDTAEIVYNLYKRDFECFNYDKLNFN